MDFKIKIIYSVVIHDAISEKKKITPIIFQHLL
jgi:hypothetical protein